jgi:hypothetical protein
MKNSLQILSSITAALLLCGSLSAQSIPTDNTRAYFEVLRTQFNADKVAVYNEVLKLTPAEAEKFWPIYRSYERELMRLSDNKFEMIREFVKQQKDGQLTDEVAARLSKKWLANAHDRLDLWDKNYKKIAAALSPARAAQYLQLEHQIALFIDLGIASEMPSITPAGTSAK